MKSLSRTYPTPELRFYRRPNGKAILQQRWCTEGVNQEWPELDRTGSAPAGRVYVPAMVPEYFWQDVPMVTE